MDELKDILRWRENRHRRPSCRDVHKAAAGQKTCSECSVERIGPTWAESKDPTRRCTLTNCSVDPGKHRCFRHSVDGDPVAPPTVDELLDQIVKLAARLAAIEDHLHVEALCAARAREAADRHRQREILANTMVWVGTCWRMADTPGALCEAAKHPQPYRPPGDPLMAGVGDDYGGYPNGDGRL